MLAALTAVVSHWILVEQPNRSTLRFVYSPALRDTFTARELASPMPESHWRRGWLTLGDTFELASAEFVANLLTTLAKLVVSA